MMMVMHYEMWISCTLVLFPPVLASRVCLWVLGMLYLHFGGGYNAFC